MNGFVMVVEERFTTIGRGGASSRCHRGELVSRQERLTSGVGAQRRLHTARGGLKVEDGRSIKMTSF